MPILDINGVPLVSHSNLSDDIRNVEFCGGTGFFGKREFPLCYSTDIEIPTGFDHFSSFMGDYEHENCHYLDGECDFFNPPFIGRKFDHIIICNPFNLGFSSKNDTLKFLLHVDLLLNDDGKLILLGNSRNPWSKYKNLYKYYGKLLTAGEIDDTFGFELESISEEHNYRRDYNYYVTGFETETFPNELITITKKVA